jgi:hypothetical protein
MSSHLYTCSDAYKELQIAVDTVPWDWSIKSAWVILKQPFFEKVQIKKKIDDTL